jgi:HNH endonuclease
MTHYAKTRVDGATISNHRLIAEQVLGKALPPGAEIHHIDGNKQNNDPSNLVVCKSRAHHMQLHARARALAACGDENAKRCDLCGGYDNQESMRLYTKGVGVRGRHSECVKAKNAAYRTRVKL